MNNKRIRDAATANRVKLWEVAAALGIADGSLSRKLRFELPEDEQTRIVGIIEQLAAGRGNVYG